MYLKSFILFSLTTVSCGHRPADPQRVEAELTLNNAPFEQFVLNHVDRFVVENEGSRRIYTPISAVSEAEKQTLISGQVLRIPDHHGFTELALVSVIDSVATVSYLTQINLTSFGENKVSIQAGTLEIELRMKDT